MKNIGRFFRDKHGQIAVWQSPNLLLLTWFASTVLQKLFKTGTSHKLFAVIAFGAIFAWAWQEISAGDSYFRRLLGLIVIIASIYSRIN